MKVEQGQSSRELPHLGEQVTRSFTVPDRNPPPERVAPAELHPSGEQEDHPRALLPDFEEHRSVGVRALRSEPRDPRDVGLGQRVEDLVETSLQECEVGAWREFGKFGDRVVGRCHGISSSSPAQPRLSKSVRKVQSRGGRRTGGPWKPSALGGSQPPSRAHRGSASQPGRKVSATPFMQYRRPVGGGPSSKTGPRCPPQGRRCPSVRIIRKLRSSVVPIASGSGAQKLGQPVRLSNFVFEEK